MIELATKTVVQTLKYSILTKGLAEAIHEVKTTKLPRTYGYFSKVLEMKVITHYIYYSNGHVYIECLIHGHIHRIDFEG